jgi:hypothetical protein
MSAINFFTPIYYGEQAKTSKEKALQNIDNYFHILGNKAFVIGRNQAGQEEVVLKKSKFSGSKFLKAVGIALSYFTVVIPLSMLISKAILRSSKKYSVIDPKNELEKGVNLTPETIKKIQSLVPSILKGEDKEGTQYIQGSKIFSHKNYPNLIFKMGLADGGKTEHNGKWLNGKQVMERRYENMIKAKRICLIDKLDLLAVPHAKKINFKTPDGKEGVLIAEERMNISSDNDQEDLYFSQAKDLNHTVKQLATLIAKTGFNDVTPRNIPIINESKSKHGQRRAALIDLEHMNNAVNGFTGDLNGSCGLIGCLANQEQFDIVMEEARKNGLNVKKSKFADAKKERINTIAYETKLRQFWQNKGIVNGAEPLQVDVDSLGLDLNEQGQMNVPEIVNGKLEYKKQKVSMREAILDVVGEINRLIQKNAAKSITIKGRRYIKLDTNEKPFSDFLRLGIPDDVMVLKDGEHKKLWMHKIIIALIAKGYIFGLQKYNGHGFFIQA